jgi:hypothetical protein
MSKSNTTLEDIFEILEVDPDGKKFDKGWLVIFSATAVAAPAQYPSAFILNASMVIFVLQLVVLKPEVTCMNWIWCWM